MIAIDDIQLETLKERVAQLERRVDQLEATAREAIELVQGRICTLEELLRPHLDGTEDPHDG